jgi:hypothetical protein
MKKIKMLNKKGFFGSIISDFFALLLFMIFVVVLFFLFKVKGINATHDITFTFQSAEPNTNLLNILRTKVEYQGENVSIGRLIIFSSENYKDGKIPIELGNTLIYNITNIFETANLTNADLVVADEKGNYLYEIARGSNKVPGFNVYVTPYDLENCEKGVAQVYLPSDKYKYLDVIYTQCKK